MVSKNTEDTALEAVDKHPEMILRRKNFAGWRINWNDKAANIVELVKELNLGLQSVVFIDDNPVERGRVREALPEVLVPEWPKDPAHYADALRRLDCFDQSAITAEDRARAEMYASDRSRRSSQTEFSSPQEWLQNLGIRVRVAPVTDVNRKRVVQLANKTNQLNLATRRFTEEEFIAWLHQEGNDARALSVADRFGDIGLTGVIAWRGEGDTLEITDYILSCRAMGRQVEELMAALAVEVASAAGKRRVVARLLPTERNGPCLEFWRRSGFAEVEPNLFVWQTSEDYPAPPFIALERS
jgi:FkbH-like protein